MQVTVQGHNRKGSLFSKAYFTIVNILYSYVRPKNEVKQFPRWKWQLFASNIVNVSVAMFQKKQNQKKKTC